MSGKDRELDTLDLLVKYNLPELPDPAREDDPQARQLWIFRKNDDAVELGWLVSYDDARAYCSREDTHGDEWFVGA